MRYLIEAVGFFIGGWLIAEIAGWVVGPEMKPAAAFFGAGCAFYGYLCGLYIVSSRP